MLARISFAFVVVSIAAFLCAQSAEAPKGPKITNYVYFDMKHGDEPIGRSVLSLLIWSQPFTNDNVSYNGSLWEGESLSFVPMPHLHNLGVV